MSDDVTVQTEQTDTPQGAGVAETEIPDTQATEQTPEGEGSEGTPKKQDSGDESKGYQRRINRLTAEKYRKAAEAERLAQENAQLMARLQALQGQPAVPANTGPKQEDFQSYEDYLQARAAHVSRTEALKAVQQYQQFSAQQTTRAQQAAAERAAEQAFQMRADKAREAYADFDESTEWLTGQVPPAVVGLLAASENSADLLYFLGKNPAELERIKALPPILQLREAALLELKAKPQTKTTKASAPINPVKGSDGGKTDWYSPTMSDKEWERFRQKRKRGS